MSSVEPGGVLASLPAWKLEDAKARFSEVARMARQHGPQRVTVQGQDAVVILSAADYALLAPTAGCTLAELFGNSPFARMDEFAEDPVRERAPLHEPPSF